MPHKLYQIPEGSDQTGDAFCNGFHNFSPNPK